MNQADYSFEEVEEGIARAERMLKKQRQQKNVILGCVIVSLLLCCCLLLMMLFLWVYGDQILIYLLDIQIIW
jgi:hypothetical protein